MKQSDLAKFYGVTERTIRRWKNESAPLDKPPRMVGWLLSRKNVPKGARAWLQQQQKEKLTDLPADESAVDDSEDEEIEEGEVKDLEVRRVELDQRLDLAMRKNDDGKIKLYGELLVKVDESIRRMQAHEKKLGLDQGEVLPRPEAERMLRAAFHAGNASIEDHLDEICKRVVGFDFPEEAYAYLKPIILGGRIFSGFGKVARVPGPPAVPQWLIDLVRDEADNYLEGADELFRDTKSETSSTINENAT